MSSYYPAAEITRLLKLIEAVETKVGKDMSFFRLHNGEDVTLIHPTDRNQDGKQLYRSDYMNEWIQDLIRLLNGDLPQANRQPALRAIQRTFSKVVPLHEARKSLDEKRQAVAALSYTHEEMRVMSASGHGTQFNLPLELRTRMFRDGLLTEKPDGFFKTPKCALLLKFHEINP